MPSGRSPGCATQVTLSPVLCAKSVEWKKTQSTTGYGDARVACVSPSGTQWRASSWSKKQWLLDEQTKTVDQLNRRLQAAIGAKDVMEKQNEDLMVEATV